MVTYFQHKLGSSLNRRVMLKRKNEESEESKESTHYVKRVALDAEAVEQKDIQQDKQKTSVSLSTPEQPDESTKREDTTGAGSSHAGDYGLSNANSEEYEHASSQTFTRPSSIPSKEDFAPSKSTEINTNNGPISSHKVQNDDPTYVHFRMLASISDTANIVGKGGDSISKIKEQSNARVNVSENLKGVPERIISVRGSAEYVAKAFGLIIRTINGEPFDQSSSIESKSYNLRLLFPHSIMGYIIGKKGSRFREIEENSAASLKANDQMLPASTDRILNITGVADAIHIATYYVAQTVIEHKQQIQKAIYYNPANFNQPLLPVLSNNSNANSSHGNRQFNNFSGAANMIQMPNPMMPGMMPQQMGYNGMLQSGIQSNMAMMGLNQNSLSAATNSRVGEISTGSDGKVNQKLYVSQQHIGLVIGRGGKNLKDIRQNTGCYVKVNDEIPGASERKLTLMGDVYSIQNAILMINNKIENEKIRKQRDANNQ